MDNYEQWQLEKYGDVLPLPPVMPDGQCDATEDELRRAEEWVNLHAELELMNHE